LLAAASLLGCSAWNYAGDQVWRLEVETTSQMEALANLEATHRLDFWTEIRYGHVDLRVSLEKRALVAQVLADNGISHAVFIADLQARVEESRHWLAKSNRSKTGHSMDWTSYHPVADMQDFMAYLAETYSDFVSVVSIGKSYEGNDMQVLQICRGGCGNKPAMWIDGGIHAREWVSPAVVTFMMNELLENDAAHPDLTQDLDWYILPSVNPDGYAYSIKTERLWRKTRSPNTGSCFGCDANRNWGYMWNTGGSSSDPCAETYMGKAAFSEIENQNIRDFVFERKANIKFFNTIHSYSQLILLPWGFSYDPPANIDDLESLANLGNDALKAVHGSIYEEGCIPCMLYVASGGSLDWALGEAGIPYSYGMELRDTGTYGFLLPPEQIIPTGEETWAFHMTAAREVAKEFGQRA